ncbi:MAG: hypothetical protein QXR73_03085 [Candidatus Micrarchaeaceae archaeon]
MEETTAKRGLAGAKFKKAVRVYADEILDSYMPYEIDEKSVENICMVVRVIVESYAVAKDYERNGLEIAYNLTTQTTSKGVGIAKLMHTAPVVDGSSAIPAPNQICTHSSPLW